MYYNIILSKGEDINEVLEQLETALSILDDVSDKFRIPPSDLGVIEGRLLSLIESIENDIEEDKKIKLNA